MEEIHSLNVKEVSTLEVARLRNTGVAEWMGPGCLAVRGCSHGHNRSQWVKSVMEKGVKGVEGLCGEADGTHTKYMPQRCVGMLGVGNQSASLPPALKQSVCLHRGVLEAAGGYGSVPSTLKV